MLHVKTYLDKSPINGIGVFAAEDIKKGELIWSFTPNIDREFFQQDIYFIKQFGSEVHKEFIFKYADYDKQLMKWILSADNDRFTNHSDNPNEIIVKDTGDTVAARDIVIGEEMTINYYTFDMFAKDKLQK
jgi:uncharacterized protein